MMKEMKDIKALQQFLVQHYGPKSACTLFVNTFGDVSIIVSSRSIAQQFVFSSPVLTIVKELIAAQNAAYGNYGFFTGLTCCYLLLQGEYVMDSIPRHHVVFDEIAILFRENLKKLISTHQRELSLDTTHDLLGLARSVIGSKGNIWGGDLEELCINIVKAFVSSVPRENKSTFSEVHIIAGEGPFEKSAYVHEGFLYKVKGEAFNFLPLSNVNIVIFDTHLNPFLENVDKRIECTEEKRIIDQMTTDLQEMTVHHNIHIVACQKVIHETIRFHLGRQGIAVLDRLGLASTRNLCRIFNFCPVSSTSNFGNILQGIHIGQVRRVSTINIQNQLYYSLEGSKPNVTLVTSINLPEEEMIRSCLDIMKMALLDGSLIPGAGCFEALCFVTLLRLKLNKLRSISEDSPLGYTQTDLVFNVFLQTFARLSVLPTGGKDASLFDYELHVKSGHLFTNTNEDTNQNMTCCCRLVTLHDPATTELISLKSLLDTPFDELDVVLKDNEATCPKYLPDGKRQLIFDHTQSKMSAVNMALECAVELHSTSEIIQSKGLPNSV